MPPPPGPLHTGSPSHRSDHLVHITLVRFSFQTLVMALELVSKPPEYAEMGFPKP